MITKRSPLSLCLALILSLCVFTSGCSWTIYLTSLVTQEAVGEYKAQETAQFKRKNYQIEIGEINTANMETPVYLPGKIRFELAKKLRQKELLPSPALVSRPRLIANASISASRPPFAARNEYDEIRTIVRVTDSDKAEIIVRKTILTPNAFGWTSDFTEITHAGQIANFLEELVR